MSRFYGRDTPPFTHLSITFSNQRFRNCSPIVDVGFLKLTSRRTVFMETWSSRWIFSSAAVHLCFGCSVIFSKQSFSMQAQSLSVIVHLRPLLLFADVFPWFVYADITLETVALDTRNDVAVFVTDSPDKCPTTIWSLSKSEESPIFQSFTRTVTQHNH
jgi:hypothetical protein